MPGDHDTPYNPLDQPNLAQSLARALERRPTLTFDDLPMFAGVGIYAIYYGGDHEFYAGLRDWNEGKSRIPIYVGKAVPKGARKGRLGEKAQALKGRQLRGRLLKHKSSIQATSSLGLKDFTLRYLIVEPIFVPLGESAMIGRYEPIWNVLIDGFGNNPQGSGRNKQMRSIWDQIHPGRPAARILQENPVKTEDLRHRIDEHLKQVVARLRDGYQQDPLLNLSFGETNELLNNSDEDDDPE